MKQSHFDIVTTYIKNYPTISNFGIADIMLEDEAIDKSHRTLRLYVAQVKSQQSVIATPDEVNKKEKIKKLPVKKAIVVEEPDDEFDENGEYYYKLDYGKDSFTIDETTVDKLFCAYSRKGLNYNKPQILSVLNVDKRAFDALVSRQGLSKESEALGPRYISENSAIKQNERIAELTEELLEKFAQSDSSMVETVVREYKKKVTDLVLNSHREEELYDSIIAHLPDLKIQRYKDLIGYGVPAKSKMPLFIVVGDMHIGLETDSFNAEAARVALNIMATNINQKMGTGAFSEVILLFLGDIMHTVSGVNHANMWKDIEPGLWGAGAIIKPYELIAEFVYNIPNVTAIYGVGGNHDRLADRKDLEPSDEGGKLVFFMLNNTFKDIKVVWDPDRVQFTSGEITFVLLHGDQGQDKKSGQEIAWNLGDSTKYNLILVGHTHSRQINKNDDGIGFRKMVCPAFCPTDNYAERLGYNSLPGYVLITPDENGYPIVADHPLHYPKLK